jgi:predicted Fe-Mo cluster-binding NifX family protein
MKLAITSESNNISAKLDPRFARSKYWYIYDPEKKDGYFFDNSENAELGHGAGIKAATKLLESQIDTLITGDIGPKAKNAVKDKIAIYKGENISVKENLDLFFENKLNKLND